MHPPESLRERLYGPDSRLLVFAVIAAVVLGPVALIAWLIG